MNFNENLCKYFDDEAKGYVNIGNILSRLFNIGVALVIIIGVLYSFYKGIMLIVNKRLFDVTNNIHDILGCFGIAMMIMISIVIIILVVAWVCEIKITKCEYKKDN